MDETKKCPYCGQNCSEYLSNGISVEVPFMKEGKIIDTPLYHAHCIQRSMTSDIIQENITLRLRLSKYRLLLAETSAKLAGRVKKILDEE